VIIIKDDTIICSTLKRKAFGANESTSQPDVCVRNLITWNDWKISDFLAVVLGVQVFVWIFISFEIAGVQIPLLQPMIGFIYCCFIPGIVLLRALNLHRIGTINTLLYSIGLSIASVYFVGFALNVGLPFLSITNPLSGIYFTLALSVITVSLCIICWLQDKDASGDSDGWHVSTILTVPNMCLFLVPFTAIFGTYLVNYFQANQLLLAMVVILASIGILVGLDRFIPRESYPIALFVISITLLLHTALISPYLWGWDIVEEHFYATLVLQQQAWDIELFGNVNGCMSIVVLAPYLTQLTGLSLTWVFKLVYPLIFSLVAVALYEVYRHQAGEKIAFFACFMLISYFQYYNGMIFLTRQMISEIFLVLLLLLMVSTAVIGRKRVLLAGFYGFALITSHYGLSYIFMGVLLVAWLLILIAGSRQVSNIGTLILSRIRRGDSRLANFLNAQEKRTILTVQFVTFFSLCTIGWYSLIASGSVLNSVTQIGNQIVSSLITELANPAASQGMNVVVSETATPLHEVWKYLFLIVNLLIVLGVLAYLFSKPNRYRFTREYIAFAFIFLALDVAGITVPYLASALSVERFYQITIIVLSPFFAYGGLVVFSTVANYFRKTEPGTMHSCQAHVMLSVFLAIFLIFNTGFIYEVTGDSPTSIALSTLDDFPKYNEREMTGAQWLHRHAPIEGDQQFLSDTKGGLLLRLNLVDLHDIGELTDAVLTDPSTHERPLFLHTANIKNDVASVMVLEKAIGSIHEVSLPRLTHDRSRVYDNSGAQTYL